MYRWTVVRHGFILPGKHVSEGVIDCCPVMEYIIWIQNAFSTIPVIVDLGAEKLAGIRRLLSGNRSLDGFNIIHICSLEV